MNILNCCGPGKATHNFKRKGANIIASARTKLKAYTTALATR